MSSLGRQRPSKSSSRAKLRFVYSLETDTVSSSTARADMLSAPDKRFEFPTLLNSEFLPMSNPLCVQRSAEALRVALWDPGLGELAQKMLMLWLRQEL